mmetsp:Transcript_23899/g.42308  ORF Transcript_23899/g.42308 Transcript_23899/m.42308 type:complete len:152 (+) Transcript_23899:439-894(+)
MNYRIFVLLISIFQLNQMLQVSSSSALLAMYFQDYDDLADRIHSAYGTSIYMEIFLALYILALVLSAPVLLLNTNLIGLHILLSYKGITTYEYILSKRRQTVKIDLETIGNKPVTDTAIDTTNFDFSKLRSITPDSKAKLEFTSPQESDRS